MVSSRTKALHTVGGLPMIEHLLRAAAGLSSAPPVVVTAPDQAELDEFLTGRAEVVHQAEPKGSGDALLAARAQLAGQGPFVVVPVDMPLLTPGTLRRLWEARSASGEQGVLLTCFTEAPQGYGRVRRGPDGDLAEIVEWADGPVVAGRLEVSCGVYLFPQPGVWSALERVTSDNSQGERYLSWVPQLLPGGCQTVELEDPSEMVQVNDRLQLAEAERAMRQRTLRRLMAGGVTVRDPWSTWVDCDVEVGQDTVLEPATVLRGRVRVGSGCLIGPFAELVDCQLGDRCRVERSQLRLCRLQEGVQVGPFNRVRPGTELREGSHLGTFTEVVRSSIGPGSQVPHLSYVGDAELDADVNIGAGSIIANWDGLAKHRTVVGEGARIGSDTVLVAPVSVGRRAYTGAGSVITKDVPAGALAVSRSSQRNLEGWVERHRAGARPVAEVQAEEVE
jgi:bifunctional UDP-N-acetylglucosamine pyrophosphorylase/glucosamine-1-phosphate N-acetyltransferase